MCHYGWKLNHQCFIYIDVQVTGLYESEGGLLNDESLLAFAITNIIEELAREQFVQFNALNFHDLSIGLLIAYDENTEIHQQLLPFTERATEAIKRITKLYSTITISEPTKQVKRIPQLLEQVRQGKRYRDYINQNQVIDLNQMKESDKYKQFYYPFDIEKEILQAVRMGQSGETTRLIAEFLEGLTEKGIKEMNIQTGIVQLFSSIQHEILHSGIHPHELFGGRNMFEELSQIRESSRMLEWLTEEVISPYVHLLEGRVNFEMKQLVERVSSYITKHYMEDISLESCADEVDTNPYTLSKAFKKIVGINFIDYLTGLRIEQAKELLLNTDMKINDISEKVGYRHSYFNRIFKKRIGVPPSQFRKMHIVQTEKLPRKVKRKGLTA